MFFTVLSTSQSVPNEAKNCAFLHTDRWDDWGKFQTQFFLTVFDNSGKSYDIGAVKIGQFGLQACSAVEVTQKGQRKPDIPETFDKLENQFFSVGQREDYYAMLYTLPDPETTVAILTGLNDFSFDLELFDRAYHEEVVGESLLRSVRSSLVRDRFHRLAHGNATLTRFEFEYVFPTPNKDIKEPTLSFYVNPISIPPTNIHVLIGRNGVGKTRCFNYLTKSIALLSQGKCEEDSPFGILRSTDRQEDDFPFSGIISVSFSAFDMLDIPDFSKSNVLYNHVGLWENSSENHESMSLIEKDRLSENFCESFSKCRTGLRAKRWNDIIKTLENDPLFAEQKVTSITNLTEKELKTFFSRLSSGHAIVLLSITRLVELVDERTLIMIDEPESHLHPPLLSAFVGRSRYAETKPQF